MTEEELLSEREQPLAGSPRWWLPGLTGVLLLALAARLVFLLETSSSPAWGVLFIDSAHYDRWARELAGGDWLGKGVFTMAPLYPYFLGAVYALLGPNLTGALLLQALLGSTSCVLLAVAGRSFLGPVPGLVAGALLALYPTAVFSDTLVQKSVLDVFLLCSLLAALGSALERPLPRRWFLTGAAAGGLMLTRENAAVLAPLLAAALVIRGRGLPAGRLAAQACAGLLGLALLLAPVAVRNWLRGGEFFLTTAQFGYNLYIGNNPQAAGTYAPLIPGEQGKEHQDARELAETALGRTLTAGEVSRYWRDQALRYIFTQPGSWLRLMGRKALLTLNAVELPDAYDEYTYGGWSVLLHSLTRLFHFGVLLPLAGAGLVVSWPRRATLWPLHAVLVLYAGSTVLFFVLSRYRLPLAPVLILFAAALVSAAAGGLLRGRLKPPVVPLVVAAGLAAIANWPVAEAAEKPLFKAMMLNNLGTSIVSRPGRSQEAAALLTEAIHLNPGFGPSYYYLGIAYKDLGRLPESLTALRAAARMLPDVPESYFQIGQVLGKMGRPAEAVPWYRRALEIDPQEPAWLLELAGALRASGDEKGEAEARGRARALGASGP